MMDDKAVWENIAQMFRKRRLARAGGATDAHEDNADFFRFLDLIWRVVERFMRT